MEGQNARNAKNRHRERNRTTSEIDGQKEKLNELTMKIISDYRDWLLKPEQKKASYPSFSIADYKNIPAFIWH
ncbi:MAG: hypothetical protein LUF92_02085 [Clostridiales bacterium]|nr:hypothetical protein [Clostridiales bacterium]